MFSKNAQPVERRLHVDVRRLVKSLRAGGKQVRRCNSEQRLAIASHQPTSDMCSITSMQVTISYVPSINPTSQKGLIVFPLSSGFCRSVRVEQSCSVIHVNLGVSAFHGRFLALDKPLLFIASRASSLNPPMEAEAITSRQCIPQAFRPDIKSAHQILCPRPIARALAPAQERIAEGSR